MQNLGKGVDEEGNETSIEPPIPAPNVAAQRHGNDGAIKAEDDIPENPCRKMMSMHEPSKAQDNTNGMVKKFGRLVVDEGRSRYVSNKFWMSLSEEVAELQDILDDPTDDEEDYPSPGSGDAAAANHQGFIFSFSSTILSLRNFHPANVQVSAYWDIYKTNIEPVMKLLHTPYTENMLLHAAEDLDHISKSVEALMFSIYFAVVTSITDSDCLVMLGIERSAALRKYRFSCEQAFARAGFLNTQDILVLQALLLFLTAVRRTDDTRYVWTLTGLLIRLENSLGVHRDGAQFGLSPFETELRRRLWWQTCTLDVRASEDHGCDPSIIDQSFDTKFPLNINDADISPSTTVTPTEHEGATEMTFDLIRYSVSTTVRRLSYAPPGPGECHTKSVTATLEDKEHIIEELHQYIEKKFLRHLDTSIPLHWVAATVARLIMAKMWLVVHHPLQRADAGAGLPQETKDRLFITSIEVIEFSRLLETEKATLKWGWLFRTYVQWHALAFVLSQLCLRTEGPDVDKAWMVIEGVFDDWGGAVSSNQRGMMWKPLRKLMARAREARQRSLERRARFPLDGSLGPVMTAPLVTQPGPMMNGSAACDFPFMPSSSEGYPPTLDTNHALAANFSSSTITSRDNSEAFSPTDLASFGRGDQTQPHPNAYSNFNDNLMSMNNGSYGNNNNGGDSSGGMDPWQYSNLPPTMDGSGKTSANALNGNGFGEQDTMMTPDWAWDDMVKEFQMNGSKWPATGAFENITL